MQGEGSVLVSQRLNLLQLLTKLLYSKGRDMPVSTCEPTSSTSFRECKHPSALFIAIILKPGTYKPSLTMQHLKHTP